jgi:dihydrofolate reductase
MLSIIAALDENGALGFGGQLLCHLPRDLQYFKKLTMGKPIVMGRKTFESIGKPLPGRRNVVLSRKNWQHDGILVLPSLDWNAEIFADCAEIMLIGGAEIYTAYLPGVTRMYLTKIHHTFAADVFFPAFALDEWRLSYEEFHEHDDKNAYSMTFCIYERI